METIENISISMRITNDNFVHPDTKKPFSILRKIFSYVLSQKQTKHLIVNKVCVFIQLSIL